MSRRHGVVGVQYIEDACQVADIIDSLTAEEPKIVSISTGCDGSFVYFSAKSAASLLHVRETLAANGFHGTDGKGTRV